MADVILREKADGSGVSACHAPEDRVGRGRCNHAPGGQVATMQKQEDGSYVLEIGDEFDSISVQGKKQMIQKFVNKLEKLDKETIQKIKDSVDW